MRAYSLRTNLQYMAMIVTSPRRLVASFSDAPSIWYGAVPFLANTVVSVSGSLIVYATHRQQAVSPMPKLLPIPDDRYLL